MPASARSFAVPPVERICTPCFVSTRANSTRPRLSLTLTSARCTLGIELLHVDPRHALADARQYLVDDRLAPRGDLLAGDDARPLRAEHDHRVAHGDVR